jgi:tetratricopeptide (TPR) repeat protein
MVVRLRYLPLGPLVLACLAVLCVPAYLTGKGNQQMQSPTRPSTLVVSVRMPDGSPLDTPAVVNLYTFTGTPAGIGVFRSGTAEFTNLSPASYTLDIVAAGYKHVAENVQILTAGERRQISISLELESADSSTSAAPGEPILAPNAQKEVTKALEDLRASKPDNARKHLEKASHVAPGHPDVNYLWGMYYAQSKDFAKAKVYWEKAIQLSPHHIFALAGLAQLALQNSDYSAATAYLLRASEAAPSTWRYQERLAEIYLDQKQYAEAQKHAERALELGKERAAGAHLVLAETFLQRNDPRAALKALDAFLASHPSGSRATEALKLSAALRKPESSPAETGIADLAEVTSSEVTASQITRTPPGLLTAELLPPPQWMPPDVDDSMPPVESAASCPLQEIQEQAGKRVSDFVDAVNRIAATEWLENDVINRSGLPIRHSSRKFSYVASVQQVRPGMYIMEEYRDGMLDLDLFPERIATIGLTALVMVFHPIYRDDYDVTCEGLSRWHGGLAWQLHFRQKASKPPRLRSYRVNSVSHPVSLRGRAWISTNTFQIETLETDLVSPVPEIQLRAEHIAVEYMPVKFKAQHQELWLPRSAEIFFDYGNRRMRRRHNFRDYMLFAVDEKQQISAPKMEADAVTPGATPRER